MITWKTFTTKSLVNLKEEVIVAVEVRANVVAAVVILEADNTINVLLHLKSLEEPSD
jgi:hypothetical protein